MANQFARRSLAEQRQAHSADQHKYHRWSPARRVWRFVERGDITLARVDFLEGEQTWRETRAAGYAPRTSH